MRTGTLGPRHRLPQSSCLACGERLAAAAAVDHDDPPKPGSCTVCFACGHIMAFDESLRLRELTADEMHDIAADRSLLAVQSARAKARKRFDDYMAGIAEQQNTSSERA